ncbi:hypothetical protein PMKS-002272 [Pichia membranifaciens]|uniref:ERAD-associated E3 ubiquitin-protein ligase component HRD3 n=1 Tax=Pichia membranifaciens TaxID=4926 RepID=A0A1Q2YGU2_9ASCO|nr:hypothetical protein PMKS-002272 [Pichia membranifaciens]
MLKDQSRIDHTYTYEIPKGTINNDTFFHEYFDYGKEIRDVSFDGNLTDNQSGFLIEISDESSVFFNINDIEQYGITEFDVPYGPLRQIDTDCFDEVVSNWTNPQLNAFAMLEKLASEEDSEALRILADLYTFGFFNTEVNLGKAKALYEKILEVESDTKTEAHAHFMLGVFYSTGLFGKTEKSQPKGLIHYRFAADLNNSQAQMTLAHKYMFGVNVAQDYETAIYYFSFVYQKTEEYLEPFQTEITKNTTDNQTITERLLIFEPTLDKFSIRWSDVDGGLYDSSSEAVNTIRYFETFNSYDKIKTYGNGKYYNSDEDYSVGDDETLDAYSMLYFAAQKNYNGDYLHARNFDLAFKYAKTCVDNGFLEPEIYELLKGKDQGNDVAFNYESPNYSFNFKLSMNDEVSPLSIFIGRCSQYLGHMYFRGHGTEVDYEKAQYYLEVGRALSGSTTFINDIGLMNYYGLGIPKDMSKVSSIFYDEWMTASTKYYKAVTLLDMFNKNLKGDEPNLIPHDVYVLLSSSATYNTLARRKLIELYEGGRLIKPVDLIAGYYNSYLKVFEFMYFDFKIPFFALLNAKADDTTSNNMWTALVGMAIESELGYEAAQSSLGSILYPNVGTYQSKSFRHLPAVYSKVYTAKRFHEAISYFELSALHSNRDSINMLGDMYYEGLYNIPGVDDPMWSKNWWTYMLPVTNNSENPDSLINSAIAFTFNKFQELVLPLKLKLSSIIRSRRATPFKEPIAIIPRALNRAVSYYQDAASMGSQIGSYSVGWAYEYGMGVAQDLHLAKRYYDNVMTFSDAGYISVKLAVFRVKMKTMLWNLLGCDGNGVKNLEQDHRTWKQRITMTIGWLTKREESSRPL